MGRASAGLLGLGCALLAAGGCDYAFSSRQSCAPDAPCVAGASCVQGECVACPACGAGELCLQAQCFSSRCGDRVCPAGQGCQDGACIDDRCVGVVCAPGTACAQGACYPLDCPGADCTPGAICYLGACTQPGCAGVQCASGEVCAGGACFPLDCSAIACADGAACVAGVCQSLACMGVECPPGARCAAGSCVSQSCGATACPSDQACVEGTCADPGCAGAACPSGTFCEAASCRACLPSELRCDDGLDEDCDGLPDCRDPDCLDRTCAPDGACATQVCGASGQCEGRAKPSGTVCRPALPGGCDLEETCDGSGLSCPAERVVGAGVECRPRAGPCDAAEACDGVSPACPPDLQQDPCTPAVVTLSEGPVFDFGVVAVGARATQTFTATNQGPSAAVLGDVSGAGLALPPPFSLQGGTCTSGAALGPAASCTLSIEFFAQSAAAVAGELRLEYFDGQANQTATVGLMGSGPAVLTISEAPAFDFGRLVVGMMGSRTFTVANTGGAAATLGTVSAAGLGLDAPFSLAGGTCASGGVVPPSGACTLAVDFVPGVAGAFTGQLDLSHQDGLAPQSAILALAGSGFTNPAMDGTSGSVRAVALAPDQKRVLGGAFRQVGGTWLGYIGRLDTDGSLDGSFATAGPGFDNTVHAIAPQATGGAFVGGWFTGHGGVPRGHVARLNADGSLDPAFASGAGFNSLVLAAAVDAAGKVVCGGWFTTYDGVPRHYVARLNADGTLDTSFAETGAGLSGGMVYAVAIDSMGRVLVGGGFTAYDGVPRPRIARLLADGSLDASFAPTGAGLNDRVDALAVDGAGRILVGGPFTTYDGVSRPYLARLNADGSLDATFAPAAAGLNAEVNAIALDRSGRAVVGGDFTSYDGIPRLRLLRLNADGSLDGSFVPAGTALAYSVSSLSIDSADRIVLGVSNAGSSIPSRPYLLRLNPDGSLDPTFAPTGTGISGPVYEVAVDASDRVLFGGSCRAYDGASRSFLARFNLDGSLDSTFAQAGTGLNDAVNGVAVEASGHVVVGGQFTSYNGTPRSRVARLNPDGTLDAAFVPSGSGFDDPVYAVAVDSSRRVIVGGEFDTFGGTPQAYLARLEADGRLDLTFAPGGQVDDWVEALLPDAQGRVLVGGWFTTVGGVPRDAVARLNADGTLDTTFVPSGGGSNGVVTSLAVDSSGRVVVGGWFTSFGGQPRPRVARLNPDGSLDATFAPVGAGLSGDVEAVAVDGSGRVVVGGWFENYDGISRPYLARLNSDGSLDTTFAPAGTGLNEMVNALAIDAAGFIVAGGDFTGFNGSLVRFYFEL